MLFMINIILVYGVVFYLVIGMFCMLERGVDEPLLAVLLFWPILFIRALFHAFLYSINYDNWWKH